MKKKCGLRNVLILAVLSLLLTPSSVICLAKDATRTSGAAMWKAGVSRVVITPEKPMWMSGYGGRDKPAQGKVHDLWAKAALIEDPAGARAVIITLDLVGIDRATSQAITSRLRERFGLKRDQISLCTSHTHSGPVVGANLRAMYFFDDHQQKLVDEYTANLIDKMPGLVAEALENLEPVTLEYGLGRTTFAVNRRNNKEADVPRLRKEGKLVGPVDHEVPVLFVKNQQGKIKGILFGYACHATVVGFYDWSGDWPGYAQIEIEKDFPGATALFIAGCGGDQNPLPRRKVELGEKYGRMMADAVKEVSRKKHLVIKGKLKTAYRELDLPFSQLPTRQELEKDLSSSNKFLVGRAKKVLAEWDRNGSLSPTYPYPVQTLKLGELVIVTLGGEVVVDYSNRIKADLDHRFLWVAGYCNDVMCYIPSRRVLSEGGYEGARSMIYYGMPTVWAPDLEEMIMKEVIRQVKQ